MLVTDDTHHPLHTPHSLAWLAGIWLAATGLLALCFKILLTSLLPLWACWALLLQHEWWILGLTQSTRSLTSNLFRYSLIWSPLLAGLLLGSYWSHYGTDLLAFLQTLSIRLGLTL